MDNILYIGSKEESSKLEYTTIYSMSCNSDIFRELYKIDLICHNIDLISHNSDGLTPLNVINCDMDIKLDWTKLEKERLNSIKNYLTNEISHLLKPNIDDNGSEKISQYIKLKKMILTLISLTTFQNIYIFIK